MGGEDDQQLTDDTNAAQNQPYDGNQPLANDFSTPAAPPDDVNDDDFPIDHPTTDTDMDEDEVYNSGRQTAASGIEAGGEDDMLAGIDMNDLD